VERLGRTELLLAADFRGLTVKELAELRVRLHEAEAELTVVKNTLARRAAAESGREGLLPLLEGPSGLVWVEGDAARAARALADFARDHEAVTIKGGLMDGASLERADVQRLASLPARDQLLAQLAGGLAAPLTGLAGGLSNLIGGLARTLAAVREARGAEEPEAPSPVPA
jgi:large subunit ribosomal protein L10